MKVLERMAASERKRVRPSEWGGDFREGMETSERELGASERDENLERRWGLQREDVTVVGRTGAP